MHRNDTIHRPYRNPLSRFIFSSCLIIVIMVCGIMGYVGYVIFRDSMMQEYRNDISEIIYLTRARIDTEDLKRCIETGEESGKFRELREFLNQVRQNYSLDNVVLSTPVKDGERYDIIQVASGLTPEEMAGQNMKIMDIPRLGDSIGQFFPPEFLQEQYDLLQNCHEITYTTSTSDFGRTYTGLLGIYTDDGTPVTMLTAGMSLDFIDSTMKKYLVVVLLIAALTAMTSITMMMFWLRHRILIPLGRIEKAASDFEEKSRSRDDPEALILDLKGFNNGDELEALADTLSSMSENMKRYVEDLIESAVKVDSLEQDLDMSRKIVKQLGELAERDTLTGIRNKNGYDKEVRKTVNELEDGWTKFGVAMIDLNFLKRINDTCGHDKGNIAITNLCRLVCTTFAHSPVFRIGGDEFVVILKGSDYEHAAELVDQFNEEIYRLSSDESLSYWERTSAAIGYAMYDAKTDKGYDDVFARADKAMYDRKNAMKAARE